MKFKIGNKVKVINYYNWDEMFPDPGSLGTISKVRSKPEEFDCYLELEDYPGEIYGFKEFELELVGE